MAASGCRLYCSVYGCLNSTLNKPNLSFFRLPADDKRLAMPVGLKELMSDISREVLRSQPENLYQYITEYLEALLITRETLSIACRICGEVSNCSCQPQLDDELSRIGLSSEDIEKAKHIILNHFDKGQVRESSLLAKLVTTIDATEQQLVEVQKAIQRAFRSSISKRKDLRVSFAKYREVSSKSPTEGSVSDLSTQSSGSDFYKPSRPSSSLDDAFEPHDTQGLDHLATKYPSLTASVSATTVAGSHVELPHRIPYSAHTSVCDTDNVLLKSEKSVLSLLKSLLFAEDREYHSIVPSARHYRSLGSIQSQDSEEIDDTIKSIFSQDISEIRSKTSKDSRRTAMFRAIHEDLNESSSGGS